MSEPREAGSEAGAEAATAGDAVAEVAQRQPDQWTFNCGCEASVCQTGNCEDAAVCGVNQLVVLTPSNPTYTTASINLVTPAGQPNHIWTTRLDVDVSAFPSGGTINFSGVASSVTESNPSACACSFQLFSQCEEYPAVGYNAGIALASNITPGSPWTMPYTFAPGTALVHFGAEGSWDSSPGTTNTSTLSVAVTP